MTENPIERLRNKLSPFTTLVQVLTLERVKIDAGNAHLNNLIEKDLKLCAEVLPEIHKHLADAENYMKPKGLDYEELSKKLSEFLASQTKEDFDKWLEMDRERMKNAQGNT